MGRKVGDYEVQTIIKRKMDATTWASLELYLASLVTLKIQAAAQGSSRRWSEARKIPKKPTRRAKAGPPDISSESGKNQSIARRWPYLANLDVRKINGRGPGHGVLSEHRGREGRPLGHGQGVHVVKARAVLGHGVAVEPLLELGHPPAHARADQPLVPAQRGTWLGAAKRPANRSFYDCVIFDNLATSGRKRARAVSCWCPLTRKWELRKGRLLGD
jgi:hypothetical protein